MRLHFEPHIYVDNNDQALWVYCTNVDGMDLEQATEERIDAGSVYLFMKMIAAVKFLNATSSIP